MSKVFEQIWDYVKDLEIIDTHEHLAHTEEARNRDTDFLKEYLYHYFSRDLISAGLSMAAYNRAVDNRHSLQERWALVEPYWEVCRNTGYGRALDIAARDLYGVEKICRSTLDQLDKGFKESLKPGHFRKVLKEKSKIRISLLDENLDCDKTFFRSVVRLDYFVKPTGISDIRKAEQQSGIRICSFDDWLQACETVLEKSMKAGAVALKSALAYDRSLHYERVTRHEAEQDSAGLFRTAHIPMDWVNSVQFGKKFQDYMMHFILKLANRRNLVYQFHTGIQESSGNMIANSEPSLLSNLFLDYPDVQFDVFHMSYPYQNVLAVLAKNFPNVFIDMCWAHIISPVASVNALIEWIDSVPVNKISAFGGDFCFVDGVYGHQVMARQNVSKALAAKIDEGVIDLDRAKEIASMVFYKNPLRIFHLEDKV